MATNPLLPLMAFVALLQGADTGLIEEFDTSPPRTGAMKLTMSPVEVMGAETAYEMNHLMLADEMIDWRVYVPRDYNPQRPPGVLVWISSIDWGGVPDRWQTLMDKHNLIWIGANYAGADAPAQERLIKAIMGPHAIDDHYTVNNNRIYVAGFADGGKVANQVQAADPVTFRGGIYMCGAMLWEGEEPGRIDDMRGNRHVFIRGCFNSREREVKGVHAEYLRAGIEQADLVTVETRQRSLPQRKYVDAAIHYLDGNPLVAEQGGKTSP